MVLVLFSRNFFKPNPVTIIVNIIYQTPSIDEAIRTIDSLTKFVEDTSINCENIAANQIKILGFNMEIAKPCINELILLCSSSIDKL